MLRLVFEDDGCEGIVTVSNELTDRTLDSLSQHTKTLQIIALTRCPNMSARSLSRLLTTNPVHTLDLHKHPDCSIGGIDDTFLKDLSTDGATSNLRVLNLYGQCGVSEAGFCHALSSGHLSGLRSFSVNNCSITGKVLDCLRMGCKGLERVSLVDCGVAWEAIKGFVEGVDVGWIKEAVLPEEGQEGGGTPMEMDQGLEGGMETLRLEVEGSQQPMAERMPRGDSLGGIKSEREQEEGEDTTDTPPPQPTSSLDPLPRLRRIYTLHPQAVETRIIKKRDAWFVDEGLDILSLWEGCVRGLAGRGWVF